MVRDQERVLGVYPVHLQVKGRLMLLSDGLAQVGLRDVRYVCGSELARILFFGGEGLIVHGEVAIFGERTEVFLILRV